MAEAPWADGTQPPAPQPVWSDPLAGLVTGVDAGSPAPLTVPVGKPVMPDMDKVRLAVDAALMAEELLKSDIAQPRPTAREATTNPAPGITPNPRPGWQLRARLRSAAGSRSVKKLTHYRHRTGLSPNAMGIGAVITLLVVAIVLVALIIYSLIDSVYSILR